MSVLGSPGFFNNKLLPRRLKDSKKDELSWMEKITDRSKEFYHRLSQSFKE